jgi:uncharacterized protein YjaZ
MGVVRTDDWLDSDFSEPKKLCKQINSDPGFYSYLLQFGMYKPNRKSWNTYQWMKDNKVWDFVGGLFAKYQKLWDGPNIKIYIFPLQTGNLFQNVSGNKGGVALKEKMFLFFGPIEDVKEIEALFVHEYHHICRINKQKKDIKEYTLLDSIILEGLAERAVEHYCGKDYRADWCERYPEEELRKYWDKLQDSIPKVKRNEELHDMILFGKKRYPKLLGYSLGYYITRGKNEYRNFSTKVNFDSPSEYFINRNKIF